MYRSKQDRKNETTIRRLSYENSIQKDLWAIPSDINTAHIPVNSYIQHYPKDTNMIAETNEVEETDKRLEGQISEIDSQIANLEKILEELGMQI